MAQKKKNSKKPKNCLFLGQSAILEYWFDIDIEWFEEIVGTREPRF